MSIPELCQIVEREDQMKTDFLTIFKRKNELQTTWAWRVDEKNVVVYFCQLSFVILNWRQQNIYGSWGSSSRCIWKIFCYLKKMKLFIYFSCNVFELLQLETREILRK